MTAQAESVPGGEPDGAQLYVALRVDPGTVRLDISHKKTLPLTWMIK